MFFSARWTHSLLVVAAVSLLIACEKRDSSNQGASGNPKGSDQSQPSCGLAPLQKPVLWVVDSAGKPVQMTEIRETSPGVFLYDGAQHVAPSPGDWRLSGHFVHGKADGLWRFWDTGSFPASESYFSGGRLDGVSVDYASNQLVDHRKLFRAGELLAELPARGSIPPGPVSTTALPRDKLVGRWSVTVAEKTLTLVLKENRGFVLSENVNNAGKVAQGNWETYGQWLVLAVDSSDEELLGAYTKGSRRAWEVVDLGPKTAMIRCIRPFSGGMAYEAAEPVVLTFTKVQE